MRNALALILLLATGCGAAAPQVKVADILANCAAYKAKPVQAMGYLGECTRDGCFLAPHKASWSAYASAWTNLQALGGSNALSDAAKRAQQSVNRFSPLGFKAEDAADDAFVDKAGPLQNSYVIMTGTIAKDGCNGIPDSDHSYGIKPTDIRVWTESEGAPVNSSRR